MSGGKPNVIEGCTFNMGAPRPELVELAKAVSELARAVSAIAQASSAPVARDIVGIQISNVSDGEVES